MCCDVQSLSLGASDAARFVCRADARRTFKGRAKVSGLGRDDIELDAGVLTVNASLKRAKRAPCRRHDANARSRRSIELDLLGHTSTRTLEAHFRHHVRPSFGTRVAHVEAIFPDS